MEARSRNVFGSVKVFVACHSVLQLSQLLVSGYMKSSISTIERRYGLSSQKSGLLAAFNEVGNTLLIVFVSFLGSHVHRPRAIGCGALLACLASLLMALPHFLSGPYRYGERRYHRAGPAWNGSGLCRSENVPAAAPSSNGSCGERESFAHEGVYPLLLFAQLLLGVASVPMQPFGISYIDDHASRKNSPLYLGILLAVTAIGPAFGFLGGAFLLRFYVDLDKMAADEVELDRGDLRWVGAWWLGFLVASCLLLVAALPYFFFPRSMAPEEEAQADEKRQPDIFQEVGFLHFLKSFPAMLCRTLRSPVYLLVVLAQVNLAAMVAGLATFMAKFIEKQFSQTADFSNVMIGGVSIPLAVLGTVSGGVLVRRRALGVGGASKLCAAAILLSLCCAFPLILLGCPTQTVDGVFPPRRAATRCASTCGCARDLFRPVCGSDGVEFTSPCRAGCVAAKRTPPTKSRTSQGAAAWAGPAAGPRRDLRQPVRPPPLAVCGPDGRHLSHGVPVPDAVLCHHPQDGLGAGQVFGGGHPVHALPGPGLHALPGGLRLRHRLHVRPVGRPVRQADVLSLLRPGPLQTQVFGRPGGLHVWGSSVLLLDVAGPAQEGAGPAGPQAANQSAYELVSERSKEKEVDPGTHLRKSSGPRFSQSAFCHTDG